MTDLLNIFYLGTPLICKKDAYFGGQASFLHSMKFKLINIDVIFC